MLLLFPISACALILIVAGYSLKHVARQSLADFNPPIASTIASMFKKPQVLGEDELKILKKKDDDIVSVGKL